MLHLPAVTLCCIDTANHALALAALERSQRGIQFARSVFLTNALPAGTQVPAGIETRAIAPLSSRDDYSRFVLESLREYVATSHVLLVQWDGFVVNPAAWTDEFLGCDYLGAKWFWYDDGMRVGNGGFSLRSRRLLDALTDARITLQGAEDETIGRAFRPLLEREHAIRFGSEALADRFAFEAAYPIGKPFGFHGLFNFCRVLPSAEIAHMASTFSHAIATSPQLLQLMRNCMALGQLDAARAIAERILRATPDHAEATTVLHGTANIGVPVVGRNEPCPCGSGRKYKHCHGTLGTSGSVASSSVQDRAAVTEGVVRQGLAAHQRGDLASAETAYQQVLHWNADHPIALHYLGVIHYQRKQAREALPLLERAASIAPTEPEFHNNLGLAFAAVDRNDDAVVSYRRALGLKPDHAVAWNNLGLALVAMNRLDEAIDAYRRSLALAPQFGEAHWNLALALLARGDYSEGWREYEWRLALRELGRDAPVPAGPRWDGVMRNGTTLLLVAEQGLGDTVQFARFAQLLAAAGMRVVLQVSPLLRSLVASAPGVDRVVTHGEALPTFDAWLPLMSIAGVLGVDAHTIPARMPYMRADRDRRAGLRAAIADVAGRRPKVGLCWAGSTHHGNDARRSIGFDELRALLDDQRMAWFSLQHGVDKQGGLVEWPARDTFDDLAALISELDLVISVDTSVAHLAGALDRPTWLLLPYAPDWRWGITGMQTRWYPSMRLFRQRTVGGWAAVIDEVRRALEARFPATS